MHNFQIKKVKENNFIPKKLDLNNLTHFVT